MTMSMGEIFFDNQSSVPDGFGWVGLWKLWQTGHSKAKQGSSGV